ncbi:MAG: DedA family protein [Desulfuromonadaceae bacterium]|nr:DedA family protein [Desulfuromonadaceae bacterium]
MNIESFVVTYGYPALLAGALLEGETVVIIAGIMAHSGYLQLPWVMGVAFCGAFFADQFFFQVGKRRGKRFFEKRPQWESRIDKVRRFLVGYQTVAVLSYRFIYGMRTITPIVIGASGFSTRRFVFLNLCSTILWAVVVSSAGYFFGNVVAAVLHDFQKYELAVMLAVAVVGGGIWFYRYRLKKR